MKFSLAFIIVVTSWHGVKAQISRYSKPAVQPQISTTPSMSNYQMDMMRQALEAKQAQYDNAKTQKIAGCTRMVNEIYSTSTSYPTIQPGFHKGIAINESFCGDVSVMVEGNKVTKFLTTSGEISVSLCSPISAAKCIARVSGEEEDTYYTVYFTEDIMQAK